MNEIVVGSEEWLNQVTEEIVEPDIRIIDPHHHLWDFPTSTYQYVCIFFQYQVEEGYSV